MLQTQTVELGTLGLLKEHYTHSLIGEPVEIAVIRLMSIEDISAMYSRKYPSQQILISIPTAMTYFDDAEESEDPISLKGQTWGGVKDIISKKVSDYLR